MTAGDLITALKQVPPATLVYCIEQGRVLDPRDIVTVHKILDGSSYFLEVVYDNV